VKTLGTFVQGRPIYSDGSRKAVQISVHKLETGTSKYGQKILKAQRKQWVLGEKINRSRIIIIIIIIIIWSK
jgi:hypothetical protein